MLDLGDRRAGSVVFFPFLTQVSGVPTAPTSLALGVYKGSDGTPTSTGVTLYSVFGGNVGAHMVKIDLTLAFYATQNDYSVFITAGNVAGNTVVGYPLATFSVENRAALTKVTLVDGVELEDWFTAVLAAAGGVAVPAGSTVQFMKQDGLTTGLTVTVGSIKGQRTASQLFS